MLTFMTTWVNLEDSACGLSRFSCVWLCDPMDCSPSGSSVHEDSPGSNTGVGCHALLQGIFLKQGFHLLCLASLMSPALQVDFFTTEPLGKPPEDIMLSEISQKDKYYIIPFISKIVKLIENTMMVSRGWRMGEFNGYEVSFLPDDQC